MIIDMATKLDGLANRGVACNLPVHDRAVG
jgi:hypothetical protein